VFDQGSVRARLQGRSYWRLRYTDGTVISEWECDWSLVPKHGRQALRLHCPNGQIAELGNTLDADGKLFQFKGGLLTIGAGRETLYQLIGIVDSANGDCRCAVWDYGKRELVSFRDNINNMQYANVGAVSLDVMGLRG
jgi:hypothetical protein